MLTAKCLFLYVSNDEKTWLVQTHVWEDFYWFQLAVQIRAWVLMQGKEKDVLRQIQELFCLRECVVSADPLHHKQPKSHFSWRVNWQGDFWHFEETAMSYISCTSWHWVDTWLLWAGTQQVVGSGIGTEILCIIVIIVRAISLYLNKKHKCLRSRALLWALLELGAEWPTPSHYAWSQRIYTQATSLWHHSKRPYSSL